MEVSFSIAQTGLHASNRRQNVVANNIANIDTDGFQANFANASTLWGPGTRVDSVGTDLEPGPPRQTGQDGDMYLAGRGFFRVQMDGAIGYTRDGRFTKDADGTLVSSHGYILDPVIQIPEEIEQFEVTRNGIVLGLDPVTQEQVDLGQISVVQFVNEEGLNSIGDNLFIETANSGQPVEGAPGEQGFPTLLHRVLEGSNVDAAEEMTTLIRNRNAYQLNLRVFQTSDSIVGRAIDLFS